MAAWVFVFYRVVMAIRVSVEAQRVGVPAEISVPLLLADSFLMLILLK